MDGRNNWYLEGEDGDPELIFNVLAHGYEYGLQMRIPIEISSALFEVLKRGRTFFNNQSANRGFV